MEKDVRVAHILPTAYCSLGTPKIAMVLM